MDSRILVVHIENMGISCARNIGIDIAKGKYLTFVDSDDYINEGIYEKMISFLNLNNDVDMVEYSINSMGCERQYMKYKDIIYHSVHSYWYEALPWFHSYVWNKIFKRSAVGNIRFKKGRFYEDKIFLAKFLKDSHPIIATSSIIGYNYVFRKGAVTNTVTTKHLIDVFYADMYALCKIRTLPINRNGVRIYGNIYCHIGDLLQYFKVKIRKA